MLKDREENTVTYQESAHDVFKTPCIETILSPSPTSLTPTSPSPMSQSPCPHPTFSHNHNAM